MKIYLISDTHFNHANIATHCDRPADFTETIIRHWQKIVKPEDCVIHLGDVFIGKADGWKEIYPRLTGRKILIRGNHDRQRSVTWWMRNGFDFACDSMIVRRCWLTHEPYYGSLPTGCDLNIHGHQHNIWHGFKFDGGEENTKVRLLWQRLFSVEYTDYSPVELDKFMSHPDKYLARGLTTPIERKNNAYRT